MKKGECGSKHTTEGEAEMAKTNKQGKKKTKRTTDGVCFPNCQMNRKEDYSMIQCHICQIWAHIQCIDESDDYIIGIWCCNNCRNLPHNVSILCDKIYNLERDIATLLKYAQSLQTTNKHCIKMNTNLCDNASDCLDILPVTTQRTEPNKLTEVMKEDQEHQAHEQNNIKINAPEAHHTNGSECIHLQVPIDSMHTNANLGITAASPVQTQQDNKHSKKMTVTKDKHAISLVSKYIPKQNHDVYIGGPPHAITEGGIRSYLWDIGVINIVRLSKFQDLAIDQNFD